MTHSDCLRHTASVECSPTNQWSRRREAMRLYFAAAVARLIGTLDDTMKVLAFTVTFAAAVPTPEVCSLNPEFVQQESVSWLGAGTPETCRHDISKLAGALDRSLDNIPAGTTLRSITVGRLISYPRLSESLKEMAASDAAWNKVTGKGHPSDNAVVARLLHESPEAAPLRVAIEREGA